MERMKGAEAALIQCVQGPEGHGRLIIKRANLASAQRCLQINQRECNCSQTQTLHEQEELWVPGQTQHYLGVGVWVQPTL